jgi:ABC-type arginine/histidine transport system permease subunit
VYDTALRLGANLRLLPREVYLHAGTRRGARALGLDYRSESVSMRLLPAALRRLRPYEVEDVLCIYKDWLATAKDA